MSSAPDFSLTGLRVDSAARLHRLVTIPQKLVLRELGELPNIYIVEIKEKLKKLFGSEPNKILLIDFLNQILPDKHQIKDLTYAKNEQLGLNMLDRKAIFDLYCTGESGERFIVALQKAKQNFFKDRSIYYASFPI